MYDLQTGAGVAGAVLDVWTGTVRHVGSTDYSGAYAFNGIGGGESCIRITHMGYQPSRVCVVVADHAVLLDLPLSPKAFPLTAVEVISRRGASEPAGGSDSTRAAPNKSRLGASAAALAAAPAGAVITSIGTAQASTQPGGPRPSTLHIRNAGAERARVVFDGAALSAPLHLGAMLPLIDPELVATAEVMGAGAAPRHDGGAMQMLNLVTRRVGTERKIRGEADLLASSLWLETPLFSGGGVVAVARRVNDELVDLTRRRAMGYDYRDAVIRVDAGAPDAASLRVSGLATREAVTIRRDQNKNTALWENVALSAVARLRHGGGDYLLTSAYSRGLAQVPVLSAPGGHQLAIMDRVAAGGERSIVATNTSVTAGFDAEHLSFQRAFRRAMYGPPIEQFRQPCSASGECRATALNVAGFLEAAARPAATVTTRFGARLRFGTSERRLDLLPRVSVSRPVAATVITMGVGAFSQPVVAEAGGSVRVRTARAAHADLAVAWRSESTLGRGRLFLRRFRDGSDMRHAPGIELGLSHHSPLGLLAASYLSESGTATGPGPHRVRQLATASLHREGPVWRVSIAASFAAGLPPTAIVLERPTELSLIEGPYPSSGATDLPDHDLFQFDVSGGGAWTARMGTSAIRVMPYARLIVAHGSRWSAFYIQQPGRDDAPQALAHLPVIPTLGMRLEFR